MHLVWCCMVANDQYFFLHFSELHIGSFIRYKNTLFLNYVLKCYLVKSILISFNCFSEYIISSFSAFFFVCDTSVKFISLLI